MAFPTKLAIPTAVPSPPISSDPVFTYTCPVLVSTFFDRFLWQFTPGYIGCLEGATQPSMPNVFAWILEYAIWVLVLLGAVKGVEKMRRLCDDWTRGRV